MSENMGHQMATMAVLPVLTGKQAEVLVYLSRYFLRYRDYPTTREMASHFGVTQTAAVMALGALHRKGYVAKRAGERRNVRLTDLALEKLQLMGELTSAPQVPALDRRAG